MMRHLTRRSGMFFVAFFISIVGFVCALPGSAQAAITESGPPIDELFKNQTVGGGTMVTFTRFLLTGDGSTSLTKVGFILRASTTLSLATEIAGVGLYKESGAHPHFQALEDLPVFGAYVANPATNTLKVLQPTGTHIVPSTATDYYLVASTSAASNIINGDAFDIVLQSQYASTSAGAIGTAYTPSYTVTLEQSATVKISEVRHGMLGNTENEFIELYNTTEFPVDLSKVPINLHVFNAAGGAGAKTLTYYKSIIPDFGFFLIGSETNYSGTAAPDAVYTTLSGNTLVNDGGFSIATSSAVASATSTKIDMMCWGAQPLANCEGGNPQLGNFALGATYERKATSTAASSTQYQYSDGTYSHKGNSSDANNNDADFVFQGDAALQNTHSPTEFPFGDSGFTDSGAPFVTSAYPGGSATGVPPDLAYVGFMFSEPVASTTVVSSVATTTVTLTAAGSSTNLCTSTFYNPTHGAYEPEAKCNLTAPLAASTLYTFTVTSNVRDVTGNQLDQNSFDAGKQNYVTTFTTGGSGASFKDLTPPSVLGTFPFPGSLNIPTNVAKIIVAFGQKEMDTGTLNSTNITLSGVSLVGQTFTFSTSTGDNILTVTLPGNLTLNTSYTLTVGTGVKNTNAIALPVAFTSVFTTGAGTDTTAPKVTNVLPQPGTTLTVNTNDFSVFFDDVIDPTTATSGAFTLAVGGSNLPGLVAYDPIAQQAHFNPSNLLPLNATLTLTVNSQIKNISGTTLGTNFVKTWTTEAANSDATGPAILYANADNFHVAVTFDEAVNENDAKTLGNYALTVDGATTTISALAGHSLTYDATARTAFIDGLALTGSNFKITVSNIKDKSGNLTVSASFTAPLQSLSESGGFLGPGSFTGSSFGDEVNFSASGIGFMPGVGIMPLGNFISASTTYMFEIPIAKQIPASGTIVVTFPSTADFGLCCVATSSSNPFIQEANKDINGPGTGTIGVKTITRNSTAKTITLTLDTATRSENSDVHDFLRFGLVDLVNPSVPKGFDSSGYVLDIKSKDASGTLLESFNANPVFINGAKAGGATTTLQGVVSGNGGKLGGVVMHMMSPQTGPMDATTDANGLYQFKSLPINTQFFSNNFGGGGEFYLWTDPLVEPTSTTTRFFGKPEMKPITATSTDIHQVNFPLTATSSAVNIDIKLTASANTFATGEKVDIFAGGPGQFVVRTVTPGTAALTASTITSIPIPQTNGFWGLGIGPAMPTGGMMGFNMPPTETTWMEPEGVEIYVSGCPSACVAKINGVTATSYTFTVSSADKTISGILRDENSQSIASAEVYAYSPTNHVGSHAQTSSSGTFSIKLISGSYIVGAHSAELGNSKEISVVVDSSGNVFVNGSPTASTGTTGSNPFVLKLTTPSYTIKGRVTDGTNAVGNAPVWAYRTDGPGNADAMTDSSTGNYTLRVDVGTWKVNSFIPSFGPMSEQTVVITSASVSDINFAPSASSAFSILSGTIYEDGSTGTANLFDAGEGIEGAVIRVSGTAGSNDGWSGTDGAYSVRVPVGTGYKIVDIFKPGYGSIAPIDDNGAAIGTLNLTSSTTKNIRVPTRRTVTVNFKDSNGNPITVPHAFVDLSATTTGLGNHVEAKDATTTSLQIANGASTTVRAYVQGVPFSNISVASDDTTNTAVISGVLGVNGTETIKIVINTATAALVTVQGTTYQTSATAGNELTDVWVQYFDETNGVHLGGMATTSGAYSMKMANGTYTAIPTKPGYIGSPVTVTVSGTTTQNFVLTPATLTISGTVTAGGSAAADAFVWAQQVGGGDVVTKTDTSGAYTLYVTSGSWRVFAASDTYAEGAYSSNPVSVSSSVSGITIALTTAATIEAKQATSNTFTDTSAGSITDSTIGVSVELDSSALGSAGSSAYLTAKETSNYPRTGSVTIVNGEATELSAISGGTTVTSFAAGTDASIDLTYTKAELATSGIDTTTEVDNLKIVAYNETIKEWESLSTVATYKDSNGDVVTSPTSNLSNVASCVFTAVGTHFSAYALGSPNNDSAPGTPTGLTATAGEKQSNKITITWVSVSGAEGYYLYRDTSSTGSFPLYASVGGTSYADTNATAGTTFYYRLSAYNGGGSAESAAAGTPSATVEKGGGGGGVSGGGGGGGGGGGVYAAGATLADLDKPTTTRTTTTPGVSATPATPAVPGVSPAVPATPATPSSAAQPSARALLVSPAFNRTLRPGMTHADVKRLQQILNADPDTQIAAAGVGSPGKESDFFGKLTQRAVERFQKKHGLASSGTPETTGFGLIGPATRAKLAEVFGGQQAPHSTQQATPTAPSVAHPSPIAATVSPVFNRGLDVGSKGEDVKRLQQLLNYDPDTQIAASGTGAPGSETEYFGSLTKAAVAKFQMKHNLVTSPSDPGYGFVGPKTRAKIVEVWNQAVGGAREIPTPPGVQAPSQSPEASAQILTPTQQSVENLALRQQQVADLVRQVEALQAQIEARGLR